MLLLLLRHRHLPIVDHLRQSVARRLRLAHLLELLLLLLLWMKLLLLLLTGTAVRWRHSAAHWRPALLIVTGMTGRRRWRSVAVKLLLTARRAVHILCTHLLRGHRMRLLLLLHQVARLRATLLELGRPAGRPVMALLLRRRALILLLLIRRPLHVGGKLPGTGIVAYRRRTATINGRLHHWRMDGVRGRVKATGGG